MQVLDKVFYVEADKMTINKYPYGRSDCKNSCFANGRHRAGTVPIMSLLDGGLAGDSCAVVCLECGRIFNQKWFLPKNQPNSIGVLAGAGLLAEITEEINIEVKK